METKVKNNSTVLNKADNTTGNKNTPAVEAPKVNNLPVSTAFNDAPKKEEAKQDAPKAESTKTETQKAEAQPQANAQTSEQPESPKAEKIEQEHEPTKKELKQHIVFEQMRRLEDTEKLVEQLSKKIGQKRKLQETIDNLDKFTVQQNEDNDDVASDSKFGRCQLILRDDEGREFVTKNAYIIAHVATEVRVLCVDKLAEVEATIVIPA